MLESIDSVLTARMALTLLGVGAGHEVRSCHVLADSFVRVFVCSTW